MRTRPFRQVDVFGSGPYSGNPVAVVHDADDLDDATMQRFASWTNLSETTFLLRPISPEADYRLRIFMPTQELPFAGHPTLGTCHAWLQAGGTPHDPGVVRQECGVGIVAVRRDGERLAFAAPALLRSGPADEATIARVIAQLGLAREAVLAAEWADNGPGWVALLLATPDAVLAVRPGPVDMDIGLVAPYPPGADVAFEVRAFFPKDGATVEDPVTGSLQAALGQWLLASARATAPYVAAQGTALGRAGRAYVTADDDGQVWVGGATTTAITGTVVL